MLYPEKNTPTLAPELFQNPPSAYRGTPFWAWNCDMTPDMLTRQIDIFKEMGLGGFHMHSRSGMAVPYLDDRFMGLVKTCVEKAKENNMLAWLYDEDRWPSGAAGGLVTRDHQYRSRSLLFTPNADAEGTLMARYDIALREDGTLASYRCLSEGETAQSALWHAYIQVAGNNPWYNNEAYLDTLSPEAVQRFIDVTHERYAQCVGEDFGGVIPAIFTDEPQFSRKKTLGFAESKQDVTLPWTDTFPKTFKARYGQDIWALLPELFWDLPGDMPSLTRYYYHAHVSERFAEAFSGKIGDWCGKHNIALTGHMMEEPTLKSQTEALGEVMQSLSYFQLPGIDMLCDRYEFTTAKQAQSVAHQYGREGVLSELYGVTGWHFDFRGHKLQGDWQAALGITVRVQHLSWVSMGGPAKRDYPASISYQSPWHLEYPYIEDHFARVNTALVRGKPSVRVGMIHPVESYWLLYGPAEQTFAKREELDEHFQNITRWLLNGLIDFNYISEALLPSQCAQATAPFQVGEMAYDALLVPACKTLRSSTVERLEAFAQAGGQLIFVGEIPTLVDAMPSDRVLQLAQKAQCIPMQKTTLLQTLSTLRDVDVRNEQGIPVESLLHQLRLDGANRWLFLCNGQPLANPDVVPTGQYTLTLRGQWKPTRYDTLTGAITPIPCTYRAGNTLIKTSWNVHDSLLLHLEPGQSQPIPEKTAPTLSESQRFLDTVAVTLSEPNVLLLNQAEYAFDDGPWQPRTEILAIDSRFRQELGYTSREGRLPQPWVTQELTKFEHTLHLRFTIHSEIDVQAPELAIESPELCQICLNGQAITAQPNGWFTDEAIQRIPLPAIPTGQTTLEIHMPIGQRFGAEWCYLLGDFGVQLQGSKATLTGPVRHLGFGDWSHQGLPFYAGNVTYHLPIETKGPFTLEVPQYRNPLLRVSLDGQDAGRLVYAPYRLEIQAAPGLHQLDITAYGNRANAFGPVHAADFQAHYWYGPGAWRTQGTAWCDEYKLWPIGILISPRIHEI